MKTIRIEELITAIEEDEEFREKCLDLYDEHMGDGAGEGEESDPEDNDEYHAEFRSARRYAVVWG
jgi:hypothetical protein